MLDSEVDAINAEASALMQRGIALLDEPRREAPIDALHCFDEALALRRQVPQDHSPVQRYLLAACLLNRADALVRLNDAAPLAAALTSYDEAIEVLESLPLAEDPAYARRLAIAHQNRSLALQARGGPEDAAAAAAAFRRALALLDDDPAAAIEDRDYLRGVVWLNLANLHLSDPAPDALPDIRRAVEQSLAYARDSEEDVVQFAALGLQARHAMCRACAPLLALQDGAMPDAVHEATDAADDGLALVRRWEQRGVDVFRPLAVDLFRFGARVYALYLPHFLDEFITENMDPTHSSARYVEDPQMMAAAFEAWHLVPRDADTQPSP